MKKHTRFITLLLVLLGAGLLYASPAHAGVVDVFIAQTLGHLVAIVVWILGKLLVMIIFLVVWVAQYNDFIKSTAVSEGWIIVRDICNMFFIIILLLIAFATVLNIEKYSWKHLLPKVLLMAILINFSKLICGVLIDFSQVIMLSFVNGFRDIAGGNFANMTGINDILGLNTDAETLKGLGDEVNGLTIAGTYILAFLYVLVSLVVMIVILCILIIRIVMLWILVVLSPLAYFLQAVPGSGEKYAGHWWSQFTNNLISGPLLAFFIWLSFVAVVPGSKGSDIIGPAPSSGETDIQNQIANAGTAGLSRAGTPEGMLKFIISIGLLVGGLIVTKQMSGAAGNIAGGAMKKLSSGAKTMSGAAAVGDRLKSFNKKRLAARDEKVADFGSRWYSRYNMAKGTGAAMATATREWAVGSRLGKVGETVAHPIKAMQKVGTMGLDVLRGGNAEKRAARRKDHEMRRAAYVTGVYTDKHGTKYEETANGRYYNADTREYATDRNGNDVTKMSKAQFKADVAWGKSLMDARATKNKTGKEKGEKKRDKIINAGMSAAQMLGILKSTTTDSADRMAAALALVVKQGFKDSEQVKMAKSLFTADDNALLTKQFKDDVDKKQAYLHYNNLETEDDQKEFMKRREEGKVETQEAAAYKLPNMFKALSDGLNDEEFVKEVKKVASHSSKHDKGVKEGLPKYMDTLTAPIVDEETGDIDKTRKVVVKITHDMKDAARGRELSEEDIRAAVKESFSRLSNKDKFQIDMHKSMDTEGAFDSEELANAFKDQLKQEIGNMSPKIIDNAAKSPDANQRTVAEFKQINRDIRRARGEEDEPADDDDDVVEEAPAE